MNGTDRLHQLVERLPESEQYSAQCYLEFLIDRQPLNEYDDPLTQQEIAESEAAWKDYVEGNDVGISFKQAMQHLSTMACISGTGV